MLAIYRNFLVPDLRTAVSGSAFHAAVAVQVRQSVQESEWLLSLAESHAEICGVVGWVDLKDTNNLGSVLQMLMSKSRKLVGVRHIAQDEADDWFDHPSIHASLGLLQEMGLTFDLLVSHGQYASAVDLVDRFPRLTFVLDHAGKPDIKRREMDPWRRMIDAMGQHKNVYCKISGLVTEAGEDWKAADVIPYIRDVLNAFGSGRCMFGSDWPVCTMAASYRRWLDVVAASLSELSPGDKHKVMNSNAAQAYSLPPWPKDEQM